MLSTFKLYGVEPTHFDNMLYFDAIKEKNRLAKLVMKKMTKESRKFTNGTENFDKCYEIYNKSMKSIVYNRGLIEEREKLNK